MEEGRGVLYLPGDASNYMAVVFSLVSITPSAVTIGQTYLIHLAHFQTRHVGTNGQGWSIPRPSYGVRETRNKETTTRNRTKEQKDWSQGSKPGLLPPALTLCRGTPGPALETLL